MPIVTKYRLLYYTQENENLHNRTLKPVYKFVTSSEYQTTFEHNSTSFNKTAVLPTFDFRRDRNIRVYRTLVIFTVKSINTC